MDIERLSHTWGLLAILLVSIHGGIVTVISSDSIIMTLSSLTTMAVSTTSLLALACIVITVSSCLFRGL